MNFIVLGHCWVALGVMGINSWLPSWEAEAITLAVMCGEWDNLASSRATAPHRSEHMGRMRMVPPECCADVEEEEGRERKSKGGRGTGEKSLHMVF